MSYAVVYRYNKQDYEYNFDYRCGDDYRIVGFPFLRSDCNSNGGRSLRRIGAWNYVLYMVLFV